MKAEQAMPKDGDVSERASDGVRAIRFDHPWGPYTDEAGAKYSTTYIMWMGNGVSFYNTLDKLEGDDWQPLHPAADHAAEVKRLTAERDEARAACKREHNYYVAAQTAFEREKSKVAALTARVAELESGSAFVGEEWSPSSTGKISWVCYTGTMEPDPELRLVSVRQDHLDVVANKFYTYAGPTTAPLPTAGDDACEVNPIVSRMCERGTKCCTVEHAPAEPDCPAEEQPSKLRDESWLREAADAEDQHASVCAGDMAPRKPDCLDGVPAVLCDLNIGTTTVPVWAYGYVVHGQVMTCDCGGKGPLSVGFCFVRYLTPILHDPTDAAAVELAGRIERGGGR